MAANSGARSDFFPAIEKKHGKPIAQWISSVKKLGKATYAEQMALLQETHGFSRNHANAVVMHVRGSLTSKRHASPEAYFAGLEPRARDTAQAIFAVIAKKHPDLELVMAWNQPMLRIGKDYVFGLSASKNHLTINPFSVEVLDAHREKLTEYVVNKHTFQVPLGHPVKASLFHSLIRMRLAEID